MQRLCVSARRPSLLAAVRGARRWQETQAALPAATVATAAILFEAAHADSCAHSSPPQKFAQAIIPLSGVRRIALSPVIYPDEREAFEAFVAEFGPTHTADPKTLAALPEAIRQYLNASYKRGIQQCAPSTSRRPVVAPRGELRRATPRRVASCS